MYGAEYVEAQIISIKFEIKLAVFPSTLQHNTTNQKMFSDARPMITLEGKLTIHQS